MDWNQDEVRKLRERKRWSQQRLATVLGCSHRVVQKWEAGEPIARRFQAALDRVNTPDLEPAELAPDQLRALVELVLPYADDGQLLAALAGRLSRSGAALHNPPPGPAGQHVIRRSRPRTDNTGSSEQDDPEQHAAAKQQ